MAKEANEIWFETDRKGRRALDDTRIASACSHFVSDTDAEPGCRSTVAEAGRPVGDGRCLYEEFQLSPNLGGRGRLRGLGSRITVAMITKDEQQAVAKVVGGVTSILPEAEILLIDSSSDRTGEIARSLGARVITQFPPRGYGPAMDAALRASRREVVVTLDCDDTYPVEFIEPMARMVLEDGYDLVDGSRLTGKPAAMPWVNFLANWSFALLASSLFFYRVRDLHSGMRAYRKSLTERLRYRAEGAALPVELLLRTIREGYRVKIITIPYRPRIGESTMRPLQSAWWTLKRIYRSRFA